MFAQGQLLVRDEYLARVLEILEQPTLEELRARLPARSGTGHRGRGPAHPLARRRAGSGGSSSTCPTRCKRWTTDLGPGIATPDHVLTVAGTAGGCPATEPEEVYADIEPYPSVCRTAAARAS